MIIQGVSLVFAVAFVCAWQIDRKRNYLLLLSGACLLFSLGAASQSLSLPPGIGANAVVSGVLYTAAVLAVAEGILWRSGKTFGPKVDIALLVAFTGLLAFFFYGYRSLITRIYIQNFGYGLIFLAAAFQLTALARGPRVDRVLFWVLMLFALSFFPRTLFTIGFSATPDRAIFADSMFWKSLQLSLAVLGVGLVMAILAAAVTDVIEDLRRERDIDPLTGILNRRGFEGRVSLQSRDGLPPTASLILCDIDRFKVINDLHGHDIGDAILRDVGRLLHRCARERDIVSRFGGEEFAVLLPETSADEAVQCAERLRIAIETTDFTVLGGAGRLTASFGVSAVRPGDDWSSLYKRVDGHLYSAKRAGRNRAVTDEALHPPAAGDLIEPPLQLTLRT